MLSIIPEVDRYDIAGFARMFCLAMGLLATTQAVAAEIYKWIDEDGRIHYGEKPPHENAVRIEIQDATNVKSNTVPQSVDREKLLRIMDEERQQKKLEKRKKEEEMRAQADKCAAVEKQLAGIQRGGVFYTRDENGERDYMTEEEVKAEIDQLQNTLDKHCN